MLNNFLPKKSEKTILRHEKGIIKRQAVKTETLTNELSQLYFYGQFLLSHIDFFFISNFVLFFLSSKTLNK